MEGKQKMNRSRKALWFGLGLLVSIGLATPVVAGPTATPTETPTASPTPSASPTPTPTATPGGTGDCLCVIHNVQPSGNMATLKNVATGGKGSTSTRTVGVSLQAEETSPGSCPLGASTMGTLKLTIVDDDGDVLINNFKGPVQCISGQTTKVKFGVTYKGPKNCKDSAVPSGNVSNGDLFVTVFETQSQDVFTDTNGIQCRAD